jgi:hypothetical protein
MSGKKRGYSLTTRRGVMLIVQTRIFARAVSAALL